MVQKLDQNEYSGRFGAPWKTTYPQRLSDQILVFEWRALLGGKIERPNFGPENQILVS